MLSVELVIIATIALGVRSLWDDLTIDSKDRRARYLRRAGFESVDDHEYVIRNPVTETTIHVFLEPSHTVLSIETNYFDEHRIIHPSISLNGMLSRSTIVPGKRLMRSDVAFMAKLDRKLSNYCLGGAL